MPPHPTQCWVGQWQVDEDARWLRTDHERIPPDSRYPWGKSHFFSNIVWGAGAQHCVGCGGIAWKQYRFHEKRCEKMLILITFSHIYLKNGCIWILIKWSYVDSDWFLIENVCFQRGKCISPLCVQWFKTSKYNRFNNGRNCGVRQNFLLTQDDVSQWTFERAFANLDLKIDFQNFKFLKCILWIFILNMRNYLISLLLCKKDPFRRSL